MELREILTGIKSFGKFGRKYFLGYYLECKKKIFFY